MKIPQNTYIQRSPARSRGFTLIEVMVALVIFALGMLGVSMYSGNALRIASTNSFRAQALMDASQVMGSFYNAANGGAVTFKTALTAFDNNDSDVYSNAQVVANNNAVVIITAAEDINGVDLLTNTASSFVSPLTLAVRVVFEGGEDDDLTNDKSARATYTFLLP